jgi:diguanylate cyclase (GGDEF)-like protein
VMGLEVAGRGRVWILVGAVPVLRDGVVQHVHTSFEDITEQVRLREELRLQASTDALTGVANRRSLMNRLSEEFAHARRHPERHFAVLAVDIDHFKLVNDNWGHAAGDAALVHVARLMQRQTRPSDLLGRSGGEEFMVLLRDTDAVAAEALAERLRTAIARSVLRHAGGRLRLTVSIGVAERRSGDTNLDAVLARADRALYAAKHAGRNQVRLGQD